MQNPVPDTGGIIKKKWIQWWDYDDPPDCSYIIQTYDTAFSTKTTADYSVIQTWGIFENLETDSRMNRIGRGILTTPGAIKSAFGFRNVSPELLQTLAEDYTRGGLYSEGLVGGDISLANAAKTFQGLEDLGVDLDFYWEIQFFGYQSDLNLVY